MRATSWRVTAKSQDHQDASGRVRLHARRVLILTRGDLRRESAGEVSKDRSSVDAVRKHSGAKGRRTDRLEPRSSRLFLQTRQLRPLPPSTTQRSSGAAASAPERTFRGILLCELPECKTEGSTAVCGKPHVRWCGRVHRRNPMHPTRSHRASFSTAC